MKIVFFSMATLLTVNCFAESPGHSELMWYTVKSGEHTPVDDQASWTQRRKQIITGMQAAMGPLPDRDKLPEFDIKQLEEFQGEGYRRETISFIVENNDRLTADLFFPQGDKPANQHSLPAMLALHPTGALGKRIVAGEGPRPNRQYAVELAQRGYVVIAPDYPSFGDYSYDFNTDNYVSGTMKGIFNHMRCIDLLIEKYNIVDPKRIGVIGHSLGGHNAMFLAAFDQRVQVIVSSCGWTPFHDYYGGNIKGWTSERYMPLLKVKYDLDPDKVPFDFYEVVAALAPRPFFSSSPLEDANFAVEGVKKTIPKAREVYDLFDAGKRLQVVYPHCDHDFPTETREQAYAFIDQALQHTPNAKLKYAAELPRIQPLEPEEALSKFEIADGFEIELAASEPMIVDPVATSFDASGRLYVIEMRDYSEQANDNLGRVRVLEDTDRDGVFDKSTIFADELSWPTAIICSQQGVFVGAAPDIYFLKDTDGDLKADEKTTVFTGFNRSNIQGLLNSFRWGIDNRIHGATSSSGGTVKRPEEPDSKAINLRGRDFSFDPIKLDLRAEAGGAQHGMSFGDFGKKFVCSNSDHAQYVIYDDRSLAKNPYVVAPPTRVSIADDGGQAPVFRSSPIEPWRIVRTRLRVSGAVRGPIEGGGRAAGYFTGATGITIFRGDAWGEDYKGTAFIGDVGSNIVHRKRLTKKGVSYVASRIDKDSEFLRSSDIWFRPVQFANSPDGCLYVLDMYREVIEHPKSLPPEIKQHLDLTSGRDRGRLYRVKRKDAKLRPLPDLYKYSLTGLVKLLDHPNSWHRETAARLLYENSQDFPPLAGMLITQLSEGATPQGRLHTLCLLDSLGFLSHEHVVTGLNDSSVGVVRHAIKLSEQFASKHAERFIMKPECFANPVLALQLALSAKAYPDQQRLEFITKLLLDESLSKDTWVRNVAIAGLSNGAGDVLAQLLNHSTHPNSDVVQSLVRLISKQNNSQEISLLLKEIKRESDFQTTLLVETLTHRPELKPQLREMLDKVLVEARATASAVQLPLNARVSAIQTLSLSDFATENSIVNELLDHQQPSEVQSAALKLLGDFGEDATTIILDHWSQFSPSLRLQAENILFARPQSIALLFERLESGEIAPSLISSAQLKVVANHKDANLQKRAKQLLTKISSRVDKNLMQTYKKALEQPGDISNGRIVFRKTCASCHRLENVGYELGPNLATMKNRGAEAILLNVLDPNREVNPQYLSYVASTNEGRTYTGMIQNESANSLTLVRAENKSDTILRADIDQLKSTGLSLMPEDLHKTITPEQLSDVIAYLLSIP